MPQLILEFSANVIEKNNIESLLKNLHALLEKMLPTHLYNCKSRAIEYNTFCIGDGASSNAFVHIALKVMPGRNQDTLKKVGDAIIDKLKNYFAESFQQLNLQITLEIIELQKTYFKIPS